MPRQIDNRVSESLLFCPFPACGDRNRDDAAYRVHEKDTGAVQKVFKGDDAFGDGSVFQQFHAAGAGKAAFTGGVQSVPPISATTFARVDSVTSPLAFSYVLKPGREARTFSKRCAASSCGRGTGHCCQQVRGPPPRRGRLEKG